MKNVLHVSADEAFAPAPNVSNAPTSQPFATPDRYHLSAFNRRIILALIRILQPKNERFQKDLSNELLNFVDDYYSYFPPMLRFLFPIGLLAFEFGTILFAMTPTPFSRLSPGKADAYIESWNDSSLAPRRDLMKGLKAIIMMGFYEHPDVTRWLNFDQAAYVEEVSIRRMNSYGEEIAQAQ